MTEDAPLENDEVESRSPSRMALAQLSYVLSLPERALRSGAGLVGGMVRESAAILVPQSFQNSRTYTAMVRQMLDFMVHDVGGVPQGDAPSSTAEVDNYVARKAVGNFIDMASLATLHLSPLLILAAISDLAYGSQAYLKELADELKAQGVIDERTRIDHVNDLLGAVSNATATTGDVFNTPPLSLEAMKQTIEETRAAVAAPLGKKQVPEKADVDRMWNELREISQREGVGMLAVGGAATMRSMGKFATLGQGALSGVKVAGSLFERHVLEHYSQAIAEIRQKGFYRTLAESSQPYIEAVWTNFHIERPTITQDLLSGKLVGGGLRAVRRWLGSEAGEPSDETAPKQAG